MSLRADNWAREEHATAIAERRGCWHCWGIAQAVNAAKKGHVPAAFPTEADMIGGNVMFLNGKRYAVINAWTETEATDGRKRWGIVTEGEEQPAAPAGATPADACKKCGRTFVEDGKFVDSAARCGDTPFCGTCADRCHDTEIADHWCEIDQFRLEQNEPKRVQPIGLPFPGFMAAVKSLTEQTTSTSSPEDPITAEEWEPLMKPTTDFDTQMLAQYERSSGAPRPAAPGCAEPGCGQSPSAHAGWELRHLYREG